MITDMLKPREREREREREVCGVFYVSVPAFHPVFCRGTRRSVHVRARAVRVGTVRVGTVSVCVYSECAYGCMCVQ